MITEPVSTAAGGAEVRYEPLPRWYVAFVHPGTWRPYKRSWRIACGWVGAAPAMLKPLAVAAGLVFIVFASLALTAMLWAVWVSRMYMFIFGGRQYVNFSHLSARQHASCPACFPARPRRT